MGIRRIEHSWAPHTDVTEWITVVNMRGGGMERELFLN